MFSATSEQRLVLGETSCGSDNLKQFLPFWAIFLATFRLRTHIKHDKVNDFLKKFDRSMQFLKCFGGLLSNIRTGNRMIQDILIKAMISSFCESMYLSYFRFQSNAWQDEGVIFFLSQVSQWRRCDFFLFIFFKKKRVLLKSKSLSFKTIRV